MAFWSTKPQSIPSKEEALPGRTEPMPVPLEHFVNHHRISPPFPDGLQTAVRNRLVILVDRQFGADVSALRRIDAPQVAVALGVLRVFTHMWVNRALPDGGAFEGTLYDRLHRAYRGVAGRARAAGESAQG